MIPAYIGNGITIYQGDALTTLADIEAESVNCVVTSPPYWGLRDYGVEGQLGLERTPAEYLERMTAIFEQVRRVLKATGTLWLNMGDCYANNGKWGGETGGKHAAGLHGEPIGRGKRNTGLKPKDLVGMPWMLAFALRTAGWYLRSDIIWSKPNPMPESVTDRPTKAHEYGKTGRYGKEGPNSRMHQDRDPQHSTERKAFRTKQNESFSAAVNELVERRNKRSVWTVGTEAFPEAHFATFPQELIKPCILAGCPAGGVVLDPFMGSGTTALVARANGCKAIGIELNPDYIEIAKRRLAQSVMEFPVDTALQSDAK